MSSLKFCLWSGGSRNQKQERWVRSPHKLDMSHVDRLNMDCRHRAGFAYRLSKLKPRASEKMGASSQTMKTFFSSSPILSVENRTSEDVYAFFFALHCRPSDIFSENRTSEDVKTFFALPINVIK